MDVCRPGPPIEHLGNLEYHEEINKQRSRFEASRFQKRFKPSKKTGRFDHLLDRRAAMPSVNISEETFHLLAEKAAALHVTVEELVQPALKELARNGTPSLPPVTEETWQREQEAWQKRAASRAGRYPPGHVVDDSRETIYGEREENQF
jgi:hypothetical protein